MKILYLGDFAGASAEYLKDCLYDLEHEVTHHDAKQSIDQIDGDFEVIILSDYPAKNLGEAATQQITEQVNGGARLVMLGGWDSFNGFGTNYATHPLAAILPVIMQTEDDRVNYSSGLILAKDPAFIDPVDLDWTKVPVICGYNAVESKANAQVLVWAKPIQSDGQTIQLLAPLPLLIKGQHGQGTILACTTDVAPHWAGGLVDWGNERRAFKTVEVGAMYVKFIQLLLSC